MPVGSLRPVVTARITPGYLRGILAEYLVEIDDLKRLAPLAGQVERHHEIGNLDRVLDVAAGRRSCLRCPVDRRAAQPVFESNQVGAAVAENVGDRAGGGAGAVAI